MTTPESLADLLKQEEGPTLDFEDSRVLSDPDRLGKLMVAFANSMGGKIVIGVDDGKIEGMETKEEHEEIVMSVARDRCDPPISLSFETVKTEDGDAYVVTVPRFELYPHALKSKGGKTYYVREGSTIREPSRKELRMLFIPFP